MVFLLDMIATSTGSHINIFSNLVPRELTQNRNEVQNFAEGGGGFFWQMSLALEASPAVWVGLSLEKRVGFLPNF